MLDNLDMKSRYTLICGLIVLCMIVFVIATGFFNTVEKPENKVDSEKINTLVNNIKDNYTMTINKNLSNEYEEILYYTDNKLELYESDSYDNGVIVYNDKLFCLDSDTMELNQCDAEYNYVNDSFYDFKFIKLLTEDCKYKYISNYKVSCDVSLNSFFGIYNELNNTSYIGNDNNISFDIDYNDGLILRRTLSNDGKSRAWINDIPVSVKTLKSIGDTLVEIHGQFANHTLLNPATHRPTLDLYTENNIAEFKELSTQVKQNYQYKQKTVKIFAVFY